MTAWPGAVEVEPGLWLHTRSWDGQATADAPSAGGSDLAGCTFVLVHGLASNATLWEGVGARLAARGARAVAVDQRGHGLSDKVDHGFDFATLASDLVAVIDALELGTPILVGQSWGGNVVIETAIRYADRVGGAVGVDGGHIQLSRAFDSYDAMVAALTPPRLAGTPRRDVEAVMRERMAEWPAHAVPSQLANFVLRPDGTVAPHLTLERHLTILDHLWEHRPSERYRLAEVPVLLAPVRGSQVDSTTAVEETLDVLPNGRLVWLDGHHDIHAQKPDVVVKTIVDALRDGFLPRGTTARGPRSEPPTEPASATPGQEH